MKEREKIERENERPSPACYTVYVRITHLLRRKSSVVFFLSAQIVDERNLEERASGAATIGCHDELDPMGYQ